MKCVISNMSSYDDIKLTKGKYYMSYYANSRGKYIGIFIGEGDRHYKELSVMTTFNSPHNTINCKILTNNHPQLENTQDLLFGDTVFELTDDELLIYLVAEGI